MGPQRELNDAEKTAAVLMMLVTQMKSLNESIKKVIEVSEKNAKLTETLLSTIKMAKDG